jgi:hypothetical protein
VVHKGDIDPAADLSPLTEQHPIPIESDPEEDADDAASIAESFTAKASAPANEAEVAQLRSNVHVQMPNLPPLPPPPMEPMPLDLTPYPDKQARKLVEREHDRQVKAYKQALKDREAAVEGRQRLEDKLRKLAVQEMLKKRRAESKVTSKTAEVDERATQIIQSTETDLQHPAEALEHSARAEGQYATTQRRSDDGSLSIAMSPSSVSSTQDAPTMVSLDRDQSRATDNSAVPSDKQKKQRDRKFCVLPKKINGERDPLWVRVFMEGHDEVSAHTGLFFVNETYERLVGDVGDRIEEWVRDDMTRRTIDECAS